MKVEESRMNRKKLYWTLTSFQVITLIAVIAAQVFSMKRMGMMRYVLFLNGEWEANLPLDLIKACVLGIIAILFIEILSGRLKTRKVKPLQNDEILELSIGGALVLLFGVFTGLFTTASFRAYYILSAGVGLAALLQNIKLLPLILNKQGKGAARKRRK